MHITRGVIVRVKEIGVLRDFGVITRTELFEDKRLEEPRCVSEVPFCRANVGHRLHDAIFWLQACAQCGGEISDLMKTGKQGLNTP